MLCSLFLMVLKCYVLVPPIAEITLSTQSFIIILIEIWTFNRKLDGSIFLDYRYMFVSGISVDSLKGLSTGMCTFLSVMESSLQVMPFYSLTDSQFYSYFRLDTLDLLNQNSQLRQYLDNIQNIKLWKS